MINANTRLSIIVTIAHLVASYFVAWGAEAARGVGRLSRTNLMSYRADDGSVAPVRTIAQWRKRRSEILEGMQRVMGPLPDVSKRCPLEPVVSEEADCGEYVRRLVTYSAEPGSRVPAYLLVPKAALAGTRRHRAVLALHQTHPAGQKVVVGSGGSPNDEYGVELAKRGFVVLAPPYTRLADYWPDLQKLGYASGTMKSIWDNMRGLDYLSTLPFVQTNGFAVIGHSLGGHNGVFTAVFDERLKVVVSSCGFDSFTDYYGGDPSVWKTERGWCQQRYMPRLLNYAGSIDQIPFDFPELIGALAPRVCLINAPLGDTNFKWRSVDLIASSAVPVYELFGAGGNLVVHHPDVDHLFSTELREAAYRLIETNLKP